MDPLSVIASTITIAGAVSASLDQIKAFYDAGNELHALMNEISELRIILSEVESATIERQSQKTLPQRSVNIICLLMTGAKDKLQQLDTMIRERLTKVHSSSSGVQVAKLAWLRQKSKVKKLQEQLKEFRLSLSSVWGAASLSDISHIQLRLDEFTIIHQTQRSQLSEHGKYLEYICQQFQRGSQQSSETVSHLQESHLTGPSSGANNQFGELQEGQPIITRRLSAYDSPLRSDNHHSSYNTIRVRASHYRRSPCEGWCSCECHKPSYIRTPERVDFLLGSLFMGYSGFPVRKLPCSERNCRKQSIPTVKVTYHFPQWFLARMIHFVLTLSYMRGPGVSLSMPRVIPDNAPVLAFAVQGNLDGIKSLFSKGVASPYDVALSNGRTALHYAVNYNHLGLSQFLIDAGADPSLEDKNQSSTITLAWERIFGGRLAAASKNIETWRCMFDDEDHLESRTFPAIHKTILGLVCSDLRQQLELSTATIDDKDADGRTALSWAAAKGDADAVKLLLHFGANPNVCSRKGQSPLHWAGQNPSERSIEIVQALLGHNADVNLVDQWNRTVLVNAAADNGDPECLKCLVDAGADINWRDCHKRTSLGYAAKRGVTRAVEFFLSRGADPHIPDHWGYTPLCEAVHENHHQVLRILLQVDGIVTTAKTKEGKSILHIAALHGDIETLQALNDGRLEVLNPLERDNEGLSPPDLFNSREDKDPVLREAFVALANLEIGVGEGDDAELQSEEDSGDENESNFVDAIEHQVDEEAA